MHDALKSAYTRIHSQIPPEILAAAFRPDINNQSIDAMIHKKVILSRVLDDASIWGGKVFRIILEHNWCEYTSSPSPYANGTSGSFSVFRVPEEAREYRDIAAVISANWPTNLSLSPYGGYMAGVNTHGATLSGLSAAALNSHTRANSMVSPTPTLHPGNVIVLHPPQYSFLSWKVTGRLKFDPQFTGMDVSSITTFSKLCEYAVKAFIYTNNVVKIDKNVMLSGVEIGMFKSIIDEYREANDKYDETLILFGGAQIFEPDRFAGVVRRMIPPR